MAGSERQSRTDLIADLLDSSEQFEFHQAVRLIERAVTEASPQSQAALVGGDFDPRRESIRFRAMASLSFPPGQIAGIEHKADASRAEGTDTQDETLTTPVEMTVPFMGLTGPNGVMPAHYTSLLIERSHLRNKDHSLREFFDLFNHRLISLFHRAWEKYRFTFAYERHAADPSPDEDLFTECLYSLVGLGSAGLKYRFPFDDHSILYYGGQFAQRTRNAVSLEQLLQGYFGLSAAVDQFVGNWLYLPVEAQSAFPGSQNRFGANLSLGCETVAGSRVWDVQQRFRIRIGPLSWQQLKALLPGTHRLESLTSLVRFYVGADFDFEVQLILQCKDIPSCRLTREGDPEPRLGWTTWIGDRSVTGMDADDPVFVFRFSDSS